MKLVINVMSITETMFYFGCNSLLPVNVNFVQKLEIDSLLKDQKDTSSRHGLTVATFSHG